MPTYDYRCEKCGETFEVWQSMADDALTTHPDCGGKVVRVFSPVGIAFKGTGFYKNDHGSRAGGATKEKSESKPTRDSESSGKPSSDSSATSGASSSGDAKSSSGSTTSSDSKASKSTPSKPAKSA